MMHGELIMVAIVDSDQLLETRQCRLLHLPNGSRAALWRGLVWPIGAGDRIDLAGPAFPLLGQNPPAEPQFGLIDSAEEAWLVLEGSVSLRDAAAGALRQAGVAVLRTGPWVGDPVDGVFGTNFIRFIRPAADDLRQSLAIILEKILTPGSAGPEPADRARALTVELLKVRAELARVEVAQTAKRLEPAAESETELLRLRKENSALLEEIADLNRQLAENAPVRSEPRRAAGRLQDEIAISLTALRPDLRLLRDSLTVIAGEFADRRGFYRAVVELRPELVTSSWKKIRGASNWLERHVSNGQDDSGRIYARRCNNGWDLLISHKSQQARDIAWLSRRGRE
jgi:hypothetical protein